jgi:ATP-dependent DNA helicase RecG
MIENQYFDKKSLRFFASLSPDWKELAKDCVGFANAQGGQIFMGVEDAERLPPDNQAIPRELPEKIQKRIREITLNVSLAVSVGTASNKAEYLKISISRANTPASTSDGRYYIRIADETKPLLGEDIQRLLNERSGQSWETLTSLSVPRTHVDEGKMKAFVQGVKASDRVKNSVKEKSAEELLDHYFFADGPLLTNLGILCIGRTQDRARLGTAPVVQFLKYDELRQKVNKIVWDDFSLSPAELVEAVWGEVPDFHESYELPDGLFRQQVPLYDEVVVRELLVNALVHRPYTQRGDIFLNLHPDSLQVVNPGLLPLGVTPRNVLHTTVRRNEGLARVFHDLRLMEREGSGFDKMYEVLLSQGRPVPEIQEGPDRVEVTIRRRILHPLVIDLIAKADQNYQLMQRERITLGILAGYEALTAIELSEKLNLDSAEALASWLGRLLQFNLVQQTGRTRAVKYFVEPRLLRSHGLDATTTLKRIEPHRLRALIEEDLRRYPKSSISEIHQRIGKEVSARTVKRALDALIGRGVVVAEGEFRWRRYRLSR